MDNLDRLQKQRQNIIKRNQRELQSIDDKILKEREHIKMKKEEEKRQKEAEKEAEKRQKEAERRKKEAEKRQKEQQAKQNKINGNDSAYQSFVKNSMIITEANKLLEEFLNRE